MANQLVNCKECGYLLGTLNTRTHIVTPTSSELQPFKLSDGKVITCPSCGAENKIT
jgi:hypothetical protein